MILDFDQVFSLVQHKVSHLSLNFQSTKECAFVISLNFQEVVTVEKMRLLMKKRQQPRLQQPGLRHHFHRKYVEE